MRVREADHSIEVIRPLENLTWDAVFFHTSSDTYILINRHEVSLLSSDLTKVINRIQLPLSSRNGLPPYYCQATLSNDGKLLVIAYNDWVVILNSPQLEVMAIEKVPSACFVEFSTADQFLLIGTWEKGYILQNNLIDN
ncbi:hypothetical protein [Pseudobacillus badius]|uniref:hypothetical protein n=1 Tax=Bacillus badius TaxID=1455 RepID=UPI0007B332AF|nr:hypothetical protein [Bacillus badius]KZR58863.1 hypothetical protein A3781_15080 [Bacillus badius]